MTRDGRKDEGRDFGPLREFRWNTQRTESL